MKEQFLWVEKYRPHTIESTILPQALKKVFQQFVDQRNIPNLLLLGKAGVGKTTIARAMCDEVKADYMVINGSMNGNIDTLRGEIQQFASSVSFSEESSRKYVLLDEADYLNPQSTQPALRNFMEEFSKNCGFILTANYRAKIIEPLQSRCSLIEFKIEKEEKGKIATQFYKRLERILKEENVSFDSGALKEVVKKYFPDFRRTLNELQAYSATGKIDAGILIALEEDNIRTLVGFMKEKNFTEVRKWFAQNSDIDTAVFFRKFYDVASTYFNPKSVPQVILLISRYQYQSAFSVDQEINLVAFGTEVMVDCLFN